MKLFLVNHRLGPFLYLYLGEPAGEEFNQSGNTSSGVEIKIEPFITSVCKNNFISGLSVFFITFPLYLSDINNELTLSIS
jgi:hypothetical protein